jgi:hypothetical protein
VGVSRDQERNPVLCIPLEEKDGLLGGRSKEIARLKTQTERGAGRLGDDLALSEPIQSSKRLRRFSGGTEKADWANLPGVGILLKPSPEKARQKKEGLPGSIKIV